MLPDSDDAEPLIRRVSYDDQTAVAHQADTARPGQFVWLLTFTAALSGLLFGYDTGVMSATLVSLKADLGHPLSVWQMSLITSITSLAALISSPLSAPAADGYGRKPVLFTCDMLFIMGALIQSFAQSVSVMTVGRAIIGLAIGAASAVAPLYIAEMSPAGWRGRLVTISALFITGGQVVAYIVGWAFSNKISGWRWMVGIGAIPAAIQAFALFAIPESPRWLVQAGSMTEAKMVLNQIYQKDPVIVDQTLGNIVKEIRQVVAAADDHDNALQRIKNTAKEIWTVPSNRRALSIACMLQAAQQLCGFNTLMYFSAIILAMVGFKSPTTTALLIALTNFGMTLVAFGAIDCIGRRRILLTSIPIMSVALLISVLAFAKLSVTIALDTTKLDAIHGHRDGSTWSVVLLFAFLLFVAAYAIGLGNVPWQQAELFPLRVRAFGSALATGTNWASNFVVGVSFLPMMQLLTPPVTMALYAAICAIAWMGIYRIYPETKGLGLEEITRVLAGLR